jgi:RHS repeat-associated protein
MRRRAQRFFTVALVYLLSVGMLAAQEQGLQAPLVSPNADRSPLVTQHASASIGDVPEKTPSRGTAEKAASTVPDDPEQPAASTRATPADAEAPITSSANTIEPQYFSGQLGGSYPVSLPPGRGGMSPALSLEYTSGAGNGWLGVGWSLVVGSIERQTKSGVNYADDKYVFHSNQGLETLVAQGNIYATEIAARFEKFEKKQAADGRPYWVVTDTRGTIREYGSSDASRLANPNNPDQIFGWNLSRVTDTLGNAITFVYTSDGGNLYLQSIRYTESPGGLAPTNIVTFENEPRTDIETSYQLGFPVRTSLRLARILIDANGHRMPSMQLSYGTSPSEATSRSLLRSIAIVAADGTQLPPTLYRYQGGQFAPASLTRVDGPAPKDTVDRQCIAADFNGDSLSDIACYSGAGGVWSLTSSSATGWTTNAIPGPAPGTAAGQCLVGDLNADGRSDLLCYTTKDGQWHRMLGNATGWGDSDFVVASSPSLPLALPVSAQCIIADLNGDGRSDLACARGGNTWDWALSLGDTFAPTITVPGPNVAPNGRNVGAQCVAADFDADGRTDIACYPGQGGPDKWQRGISTGTNGWTVTNVSGPVPGSPIGNRCLFADFNGDRRTDMLCYAGSTNPGNQWVLFFATTTGFDAAISFVGPQTTSSVSSNCVAMDLNGDGKTDLTCASPPGQWRTFLSTGTSLRDIGTTPGPTLTGNLFQQCVAGDFNGDGKGDLSCHTTADSWQMLLSDGITPDLMSGTTNVFGGQTSFEYSKAATMGSVPIPIDVVTRSTTDDGNGQQATTAVAYAGGYFSVAQHDFRGFRTARITGPRTAGVGATTVIRYHQGSSPDLAANDPDAVGAYMRGRLDRIRILDAAGAVLRETSFVYAQSATIPRFNPPVETLSTICENGVCDTTHVVRQYDRFGNVIRVEDYGDTSSADDDVSRVITYNYNEAKNLVSLPASEETLAGVPATERLTFTQFFYDSTDTCARPSTTSTPTNGLVTRITRWVGVGLADVEERVAFDEVGNVVCSSDPLGNKTTFAYDATKQFVLTSTNPLAQRTTYSYYGVASQSVDKGLFGLPRTVKDMNGAITTTEWDLLGRKTKVTSPTGLTASWSYSNLGSPILQNLRTESGGLSTSTFLDGFGRPILTRRSGPQLKFIRTAVHFNERGLAETTSLPYFEGSTPIGETRVVYDALRRPVDEFDSAGGRRTICYGSGTKDIIDENGHRTRTVTSVTGRILRVERYAGVVSHDCAALGISSDTPFSITQYRHDALGRLLRIVDAKGVATSVSWDGLSRRTVLADPAVGERHFTFDAAGNEIAWQSLSGSAVFVQYDALGRPVQKDYLTKKPLGAGDIINSYDDPGRNGIGRLTATRTANSGRTISSDLDGRPVSIDHVIGGATYHEGRKYDNLGRISELIYPDGRHVLQAYDGPVLASVSNGTAASIPYASFSDYNAAGFPQLILFENNTRTLLTYETPANTECPHATYRLCRATTFASNNAVKLQITYDYDAKGNIVATHEPGLARSFIYDEFDRLRAVASSTTNVVADNAYRAAVLSAVFPRDWASLSQPSPTIALSEGFSYNNTDNLTWKFDVGTYSYPTPAAAALNPHAPRQAGDDVLTWNRDGNLAYATGRAMAYDPEGRLVAITLERPRGRAVAHASGPSPVNSFEYEYESDGSRLRESGPSGVTIYIGALAECHVGGSCVDHIFAGSSRIATATSDGHVSYFQQDALGSTRLISDNTGIVSTNYSYTSYGTPSIRTGAPPSYLPTAFLFGGQPFAAEAGIFLFGARAYDPRLGHFLSPDEIVPIPGSTQSLNRYSYAFNNPSSMIDPDGHFGFLAVLLGIIIGAIAGGVIAHIEHLDWRQGALLGAITGAFLTFPDGFGLSSLEKAAVRIATGTIKGGVSAVLHGDNFGKGLLSGGVGSLVDQATSWFVIPDSVWGDSSSELSVETGKLANASLHGAASGALHALVSGHDIRSGVVSGARDGLLGELRKEVASVATDEVRSALTDFSGIPATEKGQFILKTPFFGNLEDAATRFINISISAGRIKPDDAWTAVKGQIQDSGEVKSLKDAGRALRTGLETELGIRKSN